MHTLRTILRRWAACAAVLVAFTSVAWAPAVVSAVMPTPEAAAPISVPLETPSKPELMMHRHGCWSGEAPADMAGKLPGHVVVSRPGRGPVYSAKLVGPALDHVFHGAHPGWTVHGFCR